MTTQIKKSNSQQNKNTTAKVSLHTHSLSPNMKQMRETGSADTLRGIQKLKEKIAFRKIQLESNNPGEFWDNCLINKAQLFGMELQRKEDIEMFEKMIDIFRDKCLAIHFKSQEDINLFNIFFEDLKQKLREIEK